MAGGDTLNSSKFSILRGVMLVSILGIFYMSSLFRSLFRSLEE